MKTNVLWAFRSHTTFSCMMSAVPKKSEQDFSETVINLMSQDVQKVTVDRNGIRCSKMSTGHFGTHSCPCTRWGADFQPSVGLGPPTDRHCFAPLLKAWNSKTSGPPKAKRHEQLEISKTHLTNYAVRVSIIVVQKFHEHTIFNKLQTSRKLQSKQLAPTDVWTRWTTVDAWGFKHLSGHLSISREPLGKKNTNAP